MSKKRLISGIQPSGRLHLGNYLGAVKQFVELQNSENYECLFFIADYHSLTQDFEPEKKRDEIFDLAASFMAAGLDSKKSTIFLQSAVPAHTDLAWILGSFASFGRMKRMTQFKEKSKSQKDNINVGLFYYPVLMAADILLYDAEVVPVGEDQVQHLELTRDLARKFNNKFGETFVEPEPIMTKTSRVKDLQSPEDKMSKSSPSGCLFIDDTPEEIEDKIMSAVTDSGDEIKYDPENKPGLSNLILIYSMLSDKTKKEIEGEFQDVGYGDFKSALAGVVVDYFEDYRNSKKDIISDRDVVTEKIKKGNQKAGSISKKKIDEVRKKTGIVLN